MCRSADPPGVRGGGVRHRRHLRPRRAVHVHPDGRVMLMLLGITGLGTSVKYIPRPVVIGFTNGIAILIASTQIRDLFGLQTPPLPGEFLVDCASGVRGRDRDRAATLLALGTIAVILGCRRVSRRIPGSIIALLAGSVVVAATGLPVDTIGSRFGAVPGRTPRAAGSGIQAGARAGAAVAGADRRHAGRDRIAALCDRGRPHVWRPTPAERRIDRAGRRQHPAAAVWRPPPPARSPAPPPISARARAPRSPA